MAPPAPGCAHVSGTTPTPDGGDGQQRGTRRQRAATAIEPVTLHLFIEPKSAIVVPRQPECELCEETRALLEGVASLSDQITRVDGSAPHEPVHHIHYHPDGQGIAWIDEAVQAANPRNANTM